MMAAVSDFSITSVEEDIFVLVYYRKKAKIIKVVFKFNDEYHLILVKEAISAAFGNINVDNCEFYWEEAQIPEDALIPLLRAKKSCGHFKLILKDPSIQETQIQPETSEESASEMDETFHGDETLSSLKFKELIASSVQTKHLLEKDPLEPFVRRAIIDCAVKYLFQEVGTRPNTLQKETMARIVCDIFRPLKSDEGLVMKWIYEKVKNVKTKMRQGNKRGSVNLQLKRAAENEILKNNAMIQKQIEYLQTRLEVDDVPKIKRALKDTLKYRMDLYANPEFSVYHTFKIFSKSLELISYEFNLRFPTVSENLLESFESFIDASCNVFKTDTKLNFPEEDCLPALRKLLTICHYAKTPTNPKDPSYTIRQMVDEFIVFSTTEEDEKPEFKEHPVIVAQGSSKKAIWKYFLQLGDTFIELPLQTKFIGAFDYLMRTYYVFNVEFPKILSVFFNFIMVNVYGIDIKSRYDQKKAKIEDLHTRSRDFLRKVQKCIQLRNEIKIQFM